MMESQAARFCLLYHSEPGQAAPYGVVLVGLVIRARWLKASALVVSTAALDCCKAAVVGKKLFSVEKGVQWLSSQYGHYNR